MCDFSQVDSDSDDGDDRPEYLKRKEAMQVEGKGKTHADHTSPLTNQKAKDNFDKLVQREGKSSPQQESKASPGKKKDKDATDGGDEGPVDVMAVSRNTMDLLTRIYIDEFMSTSDGEGSSISVLKTDIKTMLAELRKYENRQSPMKKNSDASRYDAVFFACISSLVLFSLVLCFSLLLSGCRIRPYDLCFSCVPLLVLPLWI